MGRREDTELDRELAALPPELRWREWMRRIEAVLFASTTPVAREDLARIVGLGASVDLLIEDLVVDLEGRPYEVAQVGNVRLVLGVWTHPVQDGQQRTSNIVVWVRCHILNT